jgi:phage tail-like protein
VPSRFQRAPKPLPYSFRLVIDDAVCARFQDAAGLDVPLGAPRTTVKLKRGFTTGPGLWTWRRQGNVPPKDGALVMLDGSGAEKGRWLLRAARISKWVGPDLKAQGGNDVAMTMLELTCERIEGA